MSSIKIDNNPWWVKRGKEGVVRGMDVLNGTFNYAHDRRDREIQQKADEYLALLEMIPNKETMRFHILIANYLLSERGQTKHKVDGENETIEAYEKRGLCDDHFSAPAKMVHYRDPPMMRVNFEQAPSMGHMEKAIMVGTMAYYNTSVATIIEELFEYFDSPAGDQHSRTNAWPYCLEELKGAGEILVERHKEISLRIIIELARTAHTGYARLLKTKIEIGDFGISFGKGRCRPGYDINTQNFLNMNYNDHWMEIGTADESVILHKDTACRAFARSPKIVKMLAADQLCAAKMPDLVHMVYPDGKFFVDLDKTMRDNPFPKVEDINYLPTYGL